MDNFESVRVVLQMAKAWQDMQVTLGFAADQYDDEALLRVERMLEEVEDGGAID